MFQESLLRMIESRTPFSTLPVNIELSRVFYAYLSNGVMDYAKTNINKLSGYTFTINYCNNAPDWVIEK